jgi:hypothetical protein
MAIDWMAKLMKLDGAVTNRYDVHASVIQTKSPSLNFIYGNGWGLPRGFSTIIYGPPKSGKTVIGYTMAGQVHADYPNAFVIRFDTEYRDHGQLTAKMAAAYGIDMKRYIAIESNYPKDVYDQIEGKIAAMCAGGMELGLVIIDSMNGVQGRRAVNDDGGIMTQQIGDVALTNKEGLKQVLAVQRKHNFSLLMTSHVGIEMDSLEQKRGNKFRMGASIGVQHHAEYFVFVEPNRNKAGRQDLIETLQKSDDQGLIDKTKGDVTDRGGDAIAHKIMVQMKDSTMGPKGRRGQFTFSYDQGIINQYEEIYLLGSNRGIITSPSVAYYEIPGYPQPPIHGEAKFVTWFRTDPAAQDFVLKELRRQDQAGLLKKFDARDEAELAAAEEATHQEQQAEEQEKKKGKKGKKKEDSANLEDLTVDESKLPSLFAPGAGA